jgi:SNF2 family DNA or RNA helicase
MVRASVGKPKTIDPRNGFSLTSEILMQVIDDAAIKLSLSTEAADKILSSIERSELLKETPHGKELLLCWDYSEVARATRLLDEDLPNIDTPILPSPMLRDYNWPGRFTPFKHQKDTASFLSVRGRAFCFNEAGTGKTSAAIWAADYLMNLGLIRRALIICPLSIMYSAWQDEVFKTAVHRSCSVAHGSSERRRKIIEDTHDFMVINYDGVHVVREELIKAQFDLIIIDEANAYKSATTQRWKTLAKVITPSTRLWMMTGTPASQSPLDAFGLAKLISPSRVPKYTTAWRDKVMSRLTTFQWIPKPTARAEVYNALQPAIRFTKKECLDLPEVMYQTRDIALTPQVSVYYKKLKQEMLIETAGQQISAVNAAASMNKLLQISGGAVYTNNGEVIEFDISPRLADLKSVIEETVNKVIVFVPYTHTIDVVSKFLIKEGYSVSIIQGSVSATNRTIIVSKFQNDIDPRVLVIQPQAASHGLTLTAADTIVFWSPVMSVETYIQCIGRIDRVGQVNKMTVVHLQGSDAERRVYKMLNGKVDNHQKLVELYKQELEDQ